MLKFRLARIIRARPHLFAGVAVGLVAFFPLSLIHETAIRTILAFDIGSLVFLTLTFGSFLTSQDHDISRNAMRQQEGEWECVRADDSRRDHELHLDFPVLRRPLRPQGRARALSRLRHRDPGAVLADPRMSPSHIATRMSITRWTPIAGRKAAWHFRATTSPIIWTSSISHLSWGMTFQVSDINITAKKLRRLATIQGLIGFLFNTVILALSSEYRSVPAVIAALRQPACTRKCRVRHEKYVCLSS